MKKFQKINFLVGDNDFKQRCLEPLMIRYVTFWIFSKYLMKSAESKGFSDIKTFAFL